MDCAAIVRCRDFHNETILRRIFVTGQLNSARIARIVASFASEVVGIESIRLMKLNRAYNAGYTLRFRKPESTNGLLSYGFRLGFFVFDVRHHSPQSSEVRIPVLKYKVVS